MQRAVISVVVLSIGLLAGCCNCAGTSSTGKVSDSDKPQAFHAAQAGFESAYPGHWMPIPGNHLLDIEFDMADLGFPANVTIDQPANPLNGTGPVTMDALQKAYVAALKAGLVNVQLVSTVDQPMVDATAKRLRLNVVENQEAKTIDTVLAIHNGKVYIISARCGIGGAQIGDQALDTILANWKWLAS